MATETKNLATVARVSFRESAHVRRALLQTAAYTALIGLGIVFLIPFLWALTSSLKKLDGVYAYPPTFLPKAPQWQNYVIAMSELPFGRFLVNSLIITLSTTLGQLVSGSLVAYSFAQLRWPGRDVMFLVLLSTMMLPAQVTMIPTFVMWTHIPRLTGLQIGVGTMWPLIIPGFFGGSAVYIFLMRQFFKGIPIELEEAARLDGCSRLGVFARVILPLSKPVLATVGVLAFIGHWHDFMGPLIYLESVETYTLQLGLRMFQTFEGSFMHYLMAASMIVLAPVLVLFFLAQKYFVQGIQLSGIKG